MPRKCCVTGCNSNYDSVKDKTTTFRLPRDPVERLRWIKAIPRENIPDKHDTVVCAKHFPPNFQVIKVKGRERPRDPPSVFEQIPKSLVPTPPPEKRTTTKSKSSVRSIKEDELSKFEELYKINSFENFCNSLSLEKLNDSVVYYNCLNSCCIQSKEHENNTGINKFCLIVFNDLSYEAYHAGVRCTIASLVKISSNVGRKFMRHYDI
ncbi:THAP domain-containing protein 2-like [Hydra vulgaris]|uniref:THAP domain-containing protein 2-like n=1 Tax=Hydra vulgaris TaxID=6087 RepID=UPI001F5F248E|nr:THAP domain-containing protein 2-like [Hydra vulgaris]